MCACVCVCRAYAYVHAHAHAHAQRVLADLGLDIRHITAERFPLPSLSSRLQDVALNVHAGTGFNMIRGLDPARYSVEDLMIMYMGIVSHVGSELGVQNRRGDVICERSSFYSQLANRGISSVVESRWIPADMLALPLGSTVP